MNFRRKCKFFTQSFTIFLGKWTIPWRSNLKNKKGVFFFQANDLAFHTHSMRLLSGKAETFYFLKRRTHGITD